MTVFTFVPCVFILSKFINHQRTHKWLS